MKKMIQIKQRNKKWTLKVVEEEWEFPDRVSMEKTLKQLLDVKAEHGQITQN